MSIVIPYIQNYLSRDNELRYCLRGIEKHLKSFGDVFIIGDKPEWLRNVMHIPCVQTSDNVAFKHANIHAKIMIACNDRWVSDNFLFMNDDHFIVNSFTHFPHYYNLEFQRELERHDVYGFSARNTQKITGPITRNFDVHCPIVYNKKKYIETMAGFDWNVQCGYNIKTLYCHLHNIEGVFCTDLKFRQDEPAPEKQVGHRDWFSIDDIAFGSNMINYLNKLYPNVSKFER